MATASDASAFLCSLTPKEMLLSELKALLGDNLLQLPSTEAARALRIATELSDWCDKPSSQECLTEFADWLTTTLKTCFCRTQQSLKVKKEKMWGKYHKVRTTPEFKLKWRVFLLQSVRDESNSTIQLLTDKVFHSLIQLEFKIEIGSTTKNKTSPLSFEECNALRYVAGYVCRQVTHRLESSTDRNEIDLSLSLREITVGDEADEEGGTEWWTNSIDRGGLWHINDSMYSFFHVLEEATRIHLTRDNVDKQHSDSKQRLTEKLMLSEDVLFQWELLTAAVDDDTLKSLRARLIDLYLTVRGFAYVSSCVEFYKQEHKKNLQKKKALRKKLGTGEE